MKEIDFTQCRQTLKTYRGANGSKRSIIYNDDLYMLKFPQRINGEYSNACINEYIACHIFQTLGFDTQETLLGRYNDKIVVACKDFERNGFVFADFASLKNTIIDSSENGYSTELESIFYTFEAQNNFNFTPQELKRYFWEMFIADTFLGNFDRHNGNWGFLVNFDTKEVKFAPIFDCASCLFSQANNDKAFEFGINDKDMIDKRLYNYPNSAIRMNGTKINCYNFLSTTKDKECLAALLKITKRIDLNAIYKIINDTPYISDLNKEFLRFTLNDRKERLLEAVIAENKALQGCNLK